MVCRVARCGFPEWSFSDLNAQLTARERQRSDKLLRRRAGTERRPGATSRIGVGLARKARARSLHAGSSKERPARRLISGRMACFAQQGLPGFACQATGKHLPRITLPRPPTWRWRVGAWRFFYSIDEEQQIVFMLAAESPGRAYR